MERGKGEWSSAMERFYYGNKFQFGGFRTVSGGVRRQARVLSPLECDITNKLIRHGTDRDDTKPTTSAMGAELMPSPDTAEDQTFKLNGELLHGGQGKDNTLVNIACNHDIAGQPTQEPHTSGWEGLQPGGGVYGDYKKQMQKENKHHQQRLKGAQDEGSQWETHQGNVTTTSSMQPHPPQAYQNSMCPTGKALAHPAAGLLAKWATLGCPACTGKPWTKEEIWEAVACSPHQSTLSPEANAHFTEEAAEKVRTTQARILLWDDIKDNPPEQLKISLISGIPHKSKAFSLILDLYFQLQLKNGGILASVNDTTEKTAPKGAIDQIGECLSQIIHAFPEADPTAKDFMEKWDIKDGFWRMD